MHKLSISLVLAVLVAIAGFGWGLDQLFSKFSSSPNNHDALAIYKTFGEQIAKTVDYLENPEAIIDSWSNDRAVLNLHTLDTFKLPDEVQQGFISGEPLVLETESDISIHYYMPVKKQILSLTLPGLETVNTESNLKLGFTLVFYAGIVVLILIWLYPLIRRLLILSDTAKAFGEGDLEKRVSTSSISYISDIEEEFNRMAKRIQTLVGDNKLLASAVSHDLRTPLARLRFGIDALSEESDIETREKYQRRMSDDIAEMESLVEILLSYARFDQSMIEVEKQLINLSDLLLECVDAAGVRERYIKVVGIERFCMVLGDYRYLGILINNLLRNAIQYSNQYIELTLFNEQNLCCLVFEDDGHGIPESLQKEVFKPFVRGAPEDDKKGFGMGLAIVQRVVDWHNGTIEISKSEKLKGACITIRLPRYIQE